MQSAAPCTTAAETAAGADNAIGEGVAAEGTSRVRQEGGDAKDLAWADESDEDSFVAMEKGKLGHA